MSTHTEYPTPHVTLFLLLVFSEAIAEPPSMSPPLLEDPCANMSYDNSMTAVLVILVISFFLMGFVYIYNRECGEQRFIGRSNLTTQTGTCLEVPPCGLDAGTIEKFPKFLYSEVKGCKNGRVTLECAVCLNDFADDETLRLIPKCNHVFHLDCIDAWLVNHSTCPFCRANLLPIPDNVSSSVYVDISEHEGV